MSHDAHGHGSKAKKKKKKKKEGAKFPWFGIVALYITYCFFDVNFVLGMFFLVTVGFTPSIGEAIMYPFEKISELEDKKKDEKKKHTHTSHH